MKQSLTDLQLKGMSRLHRRILQVSGGRVLRSAFGMTVVELHTVGRKSGLPRSTMLTSPIVDGDRYVIIASKGGDDRDPEWYRNLVANPDIALTVGGTKKTMHARVASDEEKAELWPRAVAAYRGYAGYQERTDRNIPMVICEPRTS